MKACVCVDLLAVVILDLFLFKKGYVLSVF